MMYPVIMPVVPLKTVAVILMIGGLAKTQTASPSLFYPFGSEAGDTFTNRSDDGSSSDIILLSPFTYFGSTYSQIYVHNNGYLTFDQPWDSYAPAHFNVYSGGDIIAPLWTDIDNSINGTISYNQYINDTVLSQATLDINQYFPEDNFTASWVFVATWDKVPYYSSPDAETSFQVVLLSGENSSFLLMNYGVIAPTNRTMEAGYVASSSDYFEILWSDGSVQNDLNLSNASNVNVSGRWAFRVKQGVIDNSTEASPSNSTAAPNTTTVPPLVFYPFGSEAGDTVNNGSDDGSSPAISLLSPFSYFGGTYSQIYVNNNGYLTFDQPWTNYTPAEFNNYTGEDVIAPFWTDIDNSFTGIVSYNQYSNGSVLSQATLDINQYFPGVNFTASWVFVATWDKVPYYSSPGAEASFQVVLISGESSSFLLMNYDVIAPTTDLALAGYVANFSDYFEILWSNGSVPDNVTNLINTSNVNVSGRWAFRLSQEAASTASPSSSTAAPNTTAAISTTTALITSTTETPSTPEISTTTALITSTAETPSTPEISTAIALITSTTETPSTAINTTVSSTSPSSTAANTPPDILVGRVRVITHLNLQNATDQMIFLNLIQDEMKKRGLPITVTINVTHVQKTSP